jgi:hypothetical protein
LGAGAYEYFSSLFSGVKPDIALVVLDKIDWSSQQPYGLPYFSDDEGQIRPGVVVMPAGRGDFWVGMVHDLRMRHRVNTQSCVRRIRTVAVGLTCSRSLTSSPSTSWVMRLRCLEICGCRRSG